MGILRHYLLALILAPLIATSCTNGSSVATDTVTLPTGIESRCDDPSGDVEVVGEYSWDFVNQMADLASAMIATGPYGTNSDQVVLLVGVEMHLQSNPVTEFSLAGGNLPLQTAAINIFPASPVDGLLYYQVNFEQTATQPILKVVRFGGGATPTIYTSTADFETGLFYAGIPLELLPGIGVGSEWTAITSASFLLDTTVAIAIDTCNARL